MIKNKLHNFFNLRKKKYKAPSKFVFVVGSGRCGTLQFSTLFKNNQKEDSGKREHFVDKKSYTYDYYVYFGNINDWQQDHILVSCYDWSKKLEYLDHLRIAIVTKEYSEWLIKLADN